MIYQKRFGSFAGMVLLVILLLAVVFPANLSADEDPSHPLSIRGGLAWSPDGETIAVATSEGVWLHNTSDLSPIRQLNRLPITVALDWHPTDDILAVSTIYDVSIWGTNTDEIIYTLSPEMGAYSVAWSPDGKMLAAGMGDDTLRVWDRETGEEQFAVEIDTGVGIRYSVTWSPDSRYLGAKRAGDFAIWDITTGQLKLTWLYDRFVNVTAWSPDGEYFASAGLDEPPIALWNPTTGELIDVIDAGGDTIISPKSFVWNPDNIHVAIAVRCCEKKGWIEVWNVESGELETTLPDVIMIGDGYYNNALAYGDDGSKLASISDDGKIYIWDVMTYEQLALYEGYTPIWDSY